MALIRPCADLRNNYNEISKICHETKEPIYITKNGSSDLVILSNEVYESILETEEEKIETIVEKHFEEKYKNYFYKVKLLKSKEKFNQKEFECFDIKYKWFSFEEFQKDFWAHIEQALDEVDKNKCISMKNAITEMEAKYGIHKKI